MVERPAEQGVLETGAHLEIVELLRLGVLLLQQLVLAHKAQGVQQVGDESLAEILTQAGGQLARQLRQQQLQLGGQIVGVVPLLLQHDFSRQFALEILLHLQGRGAAAIAAEDAVEQGLGQLVLHGGVVVLAGEEVLIDQAHQAGLVMLHQRLLVLLPALPLLHIRWAGDLVQEPRIHIAIEAVATGLLGADRDQHGPALLERLDGPLRRLQQG